MCYESDAIRNGCKKYEFVYHLACLFIHDPLTEEEDKLDQEDKYYPFSYPNDHSHSAPRKILRGEIPVPVEAASKIREHFDATKFLDAVAEMSENWKSFELFKKSFEKVGIVFEPDEDVGERLAKEFSNIICEIVEGQSNTSISTSSVIRELGQRKLEKVSPSGIYLDKQNHKIVVNGETIQVTPLIYNEEMLSDLENDIENIERENESKRINAKKSIYKPREYFQQDMANSLSACAQKILKFCNYPNCENTAFNLDSFDLQVNGVEKSLVHGQGYCSLFNSVLHMMFREFFYNKAEYKPGFMMIDTPLLGLVEQIGKTNSKEV